MMGSKGLRGWAWLWKRESRQQPVGSPGPPGEMSQEEKALRKPIDELRQSIHRQGAIDRARGIRTFSKTGHPPLATN